MSGVVTELINEGTPELTEAQVQAMEAKLFDEAVNYLAKNIPPEDLEKEAETPAVVKEEEPRMEVIRRVVEERKKPKQPTAEEIFTF